MAFTSLSKGISAISVTIYKEVPTGGVTTPNTNPKTRITPICTGSTPSGNNIGNKIGVAKTMFAEAVDIIPSIKIKIQPRNSIKVLSVVTDRIEVINLFGICFNCYKPNEYSSHC